MAIISRAFGDVPCAIFLLAAKGDTTNCAPKSSGKTYRGKTIRAPTPVCPADCGLVRFSEQENCVYCQCGPELGPGDEEVPIDQECPSPLVEGPTHFVTKVCRAPTREGKGLCVMYPVW